MSKLKQYVSLDVSLRETSVAVIGDNDRRAAVSPQPRRLLPTP
jgi:hypothetical protein